MSEDEKSARAEKFKEQVAPGMERVLSCIGDMQAMGIEPQGISALLLRAAFDMEVRACHFNPISVWRTMTFSLAHHLSALDGELRRQATVMAAVDEAETIPSQSRH